MCCMRHHIGRNNLSLHTLQSPWASAQVLCTDSEQGPKHWYRIIPEKLTFTSVGVCKCRPRDAKWSQIWTNVTTGINRCISRKQSLQSMVYIVPPHKVGAHKLISIRRQSLAMPLRIRPGKACGLSMHLRQGSLEERERLT